MTTKEYSKWLDSGIPLHQTLTKSTITIVESLLREHGIDFLTVHGRTKSKEDIESKITRKNYSNPKEQLTDISGIRAIFYFEAQLKKAREIIEKSFNIDRKNSSDKDTNRSIDQIGYRSIHYVADLGEARTRLPEYQSLVGLKFELQLRTILQHAWAELAHDRNYKFPGKLPRHIERELFLYAGMLEIADMGFDKLASQIDQYSEEVRLKTESGNFAIELDTVSLREFLKDWVRRTELDVDSQEQNIDMLVAELERFGVDNLDELQKIIPPKYAEVAQQHAYKTTQFGLVRDWMLLSDHRRYREHAWDGWRGIGGWTEKEIYSELVGEEKSDEIFDLFGYDENDSHFDQY